MDPLERWAHLAAEARKSDPDRYLCALFAPPDGATPCSGWCCSTMSWRECRDRQPADGGADPLPVVARGPRRGSGRPAAAAASGGARAGGRPRPRLGRRSGAAGADRCARAGSGAAGCQRSGRAGGVSAATSGALQELIYRALGGEDAARKRLPGRSAPRWAWWGWHGRWGSSLAPGRTGRIVAAPRAEVAGIIGALTARSSALVGEGRRAAGYPARAWMAAFLPASLTTAYLGQLQRERSTAGAARPRAAGPARRP